MATAGAPGTPEDEEEMDERGAGAAAAAPPPGTPQSLGGVNPNVHTDSARTGGLRSAEGSPKAGEASPRSQAAPSPHVWRCIHCSATNQKEFPTCWKCNSMKPDADVMARRESGRRMEKRARFGGVPEGAGSPGAYGSPDSPSRRKQSAAGGSPRARKKNDVKGDIKKQKMKRAEEQKKHRKFEELRKKEGERQSIMAKRIPISYLIQNISDTYESKELLRRLFVFVPFVIVFTLFVALGRNMTDGASFYSANSVADLLTVGDMPAHVAFVKGKIKGRQYQRSEARDQGPKFHKTFFDVGGGGGNDFYDFTEGVIVPVLWDQQRDYGYLPGEPHFALGQVELLGSMKIRTIKVRPDSCSRVNEYYHQGSQMYYMKENGLPITPGTTPEVSVDWTKPPYDFCYAKMVLKAGVADNTWGGVEERAPYGENGQQYYFRQDCQYGFQALTAEYIDGWPCGGYEVHLPFKTSHSEAMRFMYDLREGVFINDSSVRFVAVEFFTYDWSVHIFTSHKYFWEVAEGGAWIPQTQFRNFLYHTWSIRFVLDIMFLVFIAFYIGQYWHDFVQYKKQFDKGFLSYFFNLWNFWEFLNLGCFLTSWVFRIMWVKASLRQDFLVPYQSSEYPEYLNQIATLYITQVYFNAFNIVVTYLKLLKFVRMHPKLNVLTRTLGAAAENIIVVLLVFWIVVIAYSVAGNTVFGSGMHEFKNFSTSLESCMRVLLGDFDYWAMREENRAVAGLWFSTYNVFALFLLLNFIIAVISSAFGAIQEEMQQTSGTGAGIDEIVTNVSKMASNRYIYGLWYRFRISTTKPRALILRDRLVDWKELQKRMGVYKRLENQESSSEDFAFTHDMCLTRGTGDEISKEDFQGNHRVPHTFAYICPLEHLFLERPKDAKIPAELPRRPPTEWVEGTELDILSTNEDQYGSVPRVGKIIKVEKRLMNMHADLLKPARLPMWLRGTGFPDHDPARDRDGVFVKEPATRWTKASLYYRAGLRDGQRIVKVHFFTGSEEEGEPREIMRKQDLIEAYAEATTGHVRQASPADPRPAPVMLYIDVEDPPDREDIAMPQILVAYPMTWRTYLAIPEGLVQKDDDAVALAQREGHLNKEKEYCVEWLDLKDQEELRRILQVHDDAQWDEPSSCLFQALEAEGQLDNIWLNACAAWRAQTKAQEQEDNEKKMNMQHDVLRTQFQKLFQESQQRIDRDTNRGVYGWMSTDFDSRGHLLEARRVRGGFSDEKLSRICQIYGQGSPGLRGAEEHVADMQSLLSCLHLFAGAVARKVNVVYERRRRWARGHGLRIADPALPPEQVARENDATQWSNYVAEAAW